MIMDFSAWANTYNTLVLEFHTQLLKSHETLYKNITVLYPKNSRKEL